MLTIKIGAQSSTLSKLKTIEIGETLKSKFRDTEVQYLFHDNQIQGKKEACDALVHSSADLMPGEEDQTNFIIVLAREDQREIILFKKNITTSTGNFLKLLSFDSIHTLNTTAFLKEYLPATLRNRELIIQPNGSDTLHLLKNFSHSDVAGIVLPKAHLDRLLSPILVADYKVEFETSRNLVVEILNECLFIIPPLSQCPNYPAVGAVFIELCTPSTEIKNRFHSLINQESDGTARKERVLANSEPYRNSHVGVAHLVRPYGSIDYVRGEQHFVGRLNESSQQKFKSSEIWPPNAKMAPRQRERLGYKIPPDSDLYVSRGYAYPLDLVTDPKKQVIWAAGLDTWKDLSNRNLWVHGTNDGLGELEPMKLTTLLSRKLNFVKLSHLDSDTSFTVFPLISTYRLSFPIIPVEFEPKKVKAAFWRSSTEFEILAKKLPELKDIIHFVSPGSTYTKIQQDLAPKKNYKLHVTLSFEEWRNQNIQK